jgi:hypothetical protein
MAPGYPSVWGLVPNTWRYRLHGATFLLWSLVIFLEPRFPFHGRGCNVFSPLAIMGSGRAQGQEVFSSGSLLDDLRSSSSSSVRRNTTRALSTVYPDMV